jgi:hypothetical protein
MRGSSKLRDVTVIVFVEIFVCIGVGARLFQFIVIFIADYICSIWTLGFIFCGFGDVFFVGDFKKVI